MMAENLKNTASTNYLGGIRGLAALMVVTNHMLRAFYPSMITGKSSTVHVPYFELLYHSSPFIFITSGFFRVSIFFVLSGYILSKSYHETNNEEGIISAFIRRFPRLFLPVAFSVLVSFILARLSLYHIQDLSVLSKSVWLLYQVPNSSFTFFIKTLLYKVMFFGDISYNISLWTISPELKGSILLFIILGVTHNIKRKPTIFFVILCMLIFLHRYEFAAMIMGLLLNYKSGLKIKNIYIRWTFILSIILFGLYLGGFPISGISDNDPGFKGTIYEHLEFPWIIEHAAIISVFGAFLIVFAIMSSFKLKAMFMFKPLLWIGKHSFSIFFIHMMVVNSLSANLFIRFSSYFTYNISFLLVYFISIGLILYLSTFFTKYIDNPSIKVSKYMYNNYIKEFVINKRIKFSERFPDSRYSCRVNDDIPHAKGVSEASLALEV